ncbi:MAG: HEAT repeat domain-containing protein [Desulfobacteraceae bacterium]|nr:HEAT repeat domain-containing protein [Desulfobacteraceae bacterium]
MISIADFSIRRRSLRPLGTGLATSQAIATLFIWHSNQHLRLANEALQQAGWLALPAGPAAIKLGTLAAAFWGGLFYTLSIGIGLILTTWALLYLWQRLLPAKPRWLWIAAGLWLILAITVNLKGWVLYPTLFIIFTPLATALAALRRGPDTDDTQTGRLWPIPGLTLVLLTLLWTTQFTPQMFITIRDHLLLSNPVGMSVNNFYYRYTLYAAQAFKSFNQKEARPCLLNSSKEDAGTPRWIQTLANADVLAVADSQAADVIIALSPDQLSLTSPHGERVTTKPREFLADPAKWLLQFSQKSDRYAPFRRLTFVGLLVGFPVLLFVLVDGLIGRLAGLFAKGRALVAIRAALCMGIGILLFIPIWTGRPVKIQKDQIAAALSTADWPRRVAALRLMEEQKIDIADYPQCRALAQSPRVVERYYAARVMAFSRSPETFDLLLAMLRDPHPNVVCQAYYALGERHDPKAIAAIQSQMLQSDHWYTQWYAYRALKRLGWRQTR